MADSGSDRTKQSGLINHDEPLDVEAHLTSIQARISIIEDNQKKTQYLVVLNQESLSELVIWFESARKSLKFLMLLGNMLVWFSKVGTAFVVLYGIAVAITGGRFPSVPGLRFLSGSASGNEGDK